MKGKILKPKGKKKEKIKKERESTGKASHTGAGR